MASPFRDAPLPAREVRRILRRAAELAESDPATAPVERSMTRGELEAVAAELGLPASAIARAIDAPNTPAPEGVLGSATRLVLEEEIEGEPSEDDREALLDTINTAVGNDGLITPVGKTLVWKPGSSMNNRPAMLSIKLQSKNGRTHVRMDDVLIGQAIGLYVGLGVGGGIGPMAGYVFAAMAWGPIALVIPIVWIGCMLLLARTLFQRIASSRMNAMHLAMTRIREASEAWPREGARKRVAIPSEDTIVEDDEQQAVLRTSSTNP